MSNLKLISNGGEAYEGVVERMSCPVDPPLEASVKLTSAARPNITLLSDFEDYVIKLAAAEVTFVRPHLPRLDRLEDLLPRRTRNFWWRVRGRDDEKVGQSTESEIVIKSSPRAVLKMVQPGTVLDALEVVSDTPTTAVER